MLGRLFTCFEVDTQWALEMGGRILMAHLQSMNIGRNQLLFAFELLADKILQN